MDVCVHDEPVRVASIPAIDGAFEIHLGKLKDAGPVGASHWEELGQVLHPIGTSIWSNVFVLLLATK